MLTLWVERLGDVAVRARYRPFVTGVKGPGGDLAVTISPAIAKPKVSQKPSM